MNPGNHGYFNGVRLKKMGYYLNNTIRSKYSGQIENETNIGSKNSQTKIFF